MWVIGGGFGAQHSMEGGKTRSPRLRGGTCRGGGASAAATAPPGKGAPRAVEVREGDALRTERVLTGRGPPQRCRDVTPRRARGGVGATGPRR